MALARALILGWAEAGAWRINASAALAWLLSGIGKLRFGPANFEAGSLARVDAFNLAII
jgi:hypothetical protein